MAAPSRVLDGSQLYGTPTITTITAGIAYKLNNIQITRPVETAMDQTDIATAPDGTAATSNGI
jgi:hypothetical protein